MAASGALNPDALPWGQRIRLVRGRAVTLAAEKAEEWLRTGTGAMSKRDAARWRGASSLSDLGELVCAWLAGEITQTPGHCGPPCRETEPMMAVLAAANRAGYVTDNSQRGGFDWEGNCADVSGFASDDTLARLREAIPAPLILGACRGRHHEHNPAFERRGCPRRGVNGFWVTASPDAASEIRAAWYVTIADPEPGRNSALWAVLARFASS